ncbi:hypothetical protein VD0004_g7507 [Verticillium dahliae]|uniref:Protein arginine methyltransferase NDUFAF7 n=1 Tax=Verticillium dahliae TaxID=27337 RepID=A0A444RVR7_VERDA|nr:hypothetical protein VD0004_g7507 [Verticillium dahliae]PNH68747.1 hypothetical protein VD0001_g7406 [Verticillium dahliae]RXG45224.1 hypothetical protein VDGE_06635 [Verticillium dahliae]
MATRILFAPQSILRASRCALRPQTLRLSQATRNLSCSACRRQSESEDRKWTTPLAKQLADAISITGPVPLASYMRMCMTGDIGGYYTGLIEQGRDQFGTKGDFVTSPEISQIFGELVGIWFVTEWMSQGKPKKGVELIELGPGRGTLMDDILRTVQNFKEFANSIDAIYMVEASPTLREAQKNLLCGPDAPMTESKIGHHSISKYGNIPIIWTGVVKAIPEGPDKMPLMVAHEFFDALPIHAFQSAKKAPPPTPPRMPTSNPPNSPTQTEPSVVEASPLSAFEWRELVVSPTPPDATHATLNTPTSEQKDMVPEFQLTLSPGPTKHALYVPESSQRYRALKSVPGSVIEVCPDASMFAGDLAARIGGTAEAPRKRPAGAALILDYGTEDTIPINSLRGIRRHRRVNPFTEPGLVDLSADVDFAALAEAVTKASDGVEVHGPVEQAAFLGQMGIKERAEMLSKRAGLPKERAEDIEKSWRRLVDRGPGGMGKVYKVMAILPENDGQRRPVGFGGDV